MSFLMPKMPSPPPLVMPETKDVPNYEDEAREKETREALEASERKRKGRRSTILTGTGLTTEPELYKKTLLGA
jgi:hypothetical protein